MTALSRRSHLTIAESRGRQLLALFLAKRETAGLSSYSLRNYRDSIGRYLDWYATPADPADWTDEHVDLWLGSLRAEGLRPATLSHYQRDLLVFLGWLADRGDMPDIRKRIERVRVPLTRGRTATSETVSALLVAAGKSRTPHRDAALIRVLWSTGLRRTELSQVDLADVDLRPSTPKDIGASTIRLRAELTKARRESLVPFDPGTRAGLLEYIAEERGQSPGPLFLSSRSRNARMSTDAMRQVLDALSERAGVRASSHDFRRGFAARMRREGMDIAHTARLLRHSTLTMSLRYSEEGEDEAAIRAYRTRGIS